MFFFEAKSKIEDLVRKQNSPSDLIKYFPNKTCVQYSAWGKLNYQTKTKPLKTIIFLTLSGTGGGGFKLTHTFLSFYHGQTAHGNGWKLPSSAQAQAQAQLGLSWLYSQLIQPPPPTPTHPPTHPHPPGKVFSQLHLTKYV